MCKSDVFDDPKHVGFIMPILEWYRYRHYTYKSNRAAEKIYITSLVAADADAADSPAAGTAVEPARPAIYEEFENKSSGRHTTKPKNGPPRSVPCEVWEIDRDRDQAANIAEDQGS